MDRIIYTCKNCGWKTSIIAQWADLRPKSCITKNCKTSFVKNPDALLVEHTETKESIKQQIQNIDIANDSSDALEKFDRKRRSGPR